MKRILLDWLGSTMYGLLWTIVLTAFGFLFFWMLTL